jgi:hypothetical protein
MANNEEKTILQGALEFAAGTLAALGVEAAVKAAKQQLGIAAEAKAKELFVDTGDRSKILAAAAKLMIDTDPAKSNAGRNVRKWIVEAWNDHHEEGELTSLLKKVSDEDKPAVFQMLGSLESYDEFSETIRSFLTHDNALQTALKFVRQAESTGGTIAKNDLRALATNVAHGLNDAAGAMLPGLRRLDAWLEEKGHGKRY